MVLTVLSFLPVLFSFHSMLAIGALFLLCYLSYSIYVKIIIFSRTPNANGTLWPNCADVPFVAYD